MSGGLLVAMATCVMVAWARPASAALFIGMGDFGGMFMNPFFEPYNVTYSGPMRLTFDSMVYELSPGHWETAYFLDLVTLDPVHWHSYFEGDGSGIARLWTAGDDGFAYPMGGGAYAPLCVSVGGIGTMGNHVFWLSHLEQTEDQLSVSGSIAHDVYSTSLGFRFDGTEVPEPASLALIGVGLLGLEIARRLKRCG